MVDQILFPPWRNEQYFSRYPFVDSASLKNSAGVEIDNALFDDAVIHPMGGAAGAFLGMISVSGRVITFHIYDSENGETAHGDFDFDSADTPQAGLIKLVDNYGRPAGALVSDHDRLTALAGVYGEGEYEFERAQTEFVAAVVIPLPNIAVSGFLLPDGTAIGGDVWLVGENGVVLTLEDGAIRVDIPGDPYAKKKDCDEQDQPLDPFCGVRTINEIPPDENGDFKLTIGGNEATDPALRIEQEASMIKIKLLGTKGITE